MSVLQPKIVKLRHALRVNKAVVALICGMLLLISPAQAQFGDLLKNVRQLNQASHSVGGISGQLQAFVTSIQSITQVSISPQSDEAKGEQDASSDKVILYTTARCGYCKLAMKHVRERQIAHLERNIDTNASYAAQFKRLGGNGVPHILFGSTVMRGFTASQFDKQYSAWQASTNSNPSPSPSPSPSLSLSATVTGSMSTGDVVH